MRVLIRAITSLMFLFSIAHHGDAACSMTSPCVEELGQGQPFVEPRQIYYPHPRTWSINMYVDIGEIQFGWLKLKRRLYNGEIVGPTWNVKKGSRIRMILHNRLSDKNNQQNKTLNEMNHPNSTNMHTHGLHVSSDDPQDNVLRRIDPGETYGYLYELRPTHPSGTYWYHAHLHHSTNFQVHSGMSGMLIVEDEYMPWRLAAASCPWNCESDIQMVFQPLLIYSGFLGFGLIQDAIGDDPYFQQDNITTDKNMSLTDWLRENVNFMTVNGLLQPVHKIVQRRLYRFRMVNAAGTDTLEVFIALKGTTTPASSCEIREIALDGVYLDAPRRMHEGQTLIASGQRMDWLVKCSRPGTYELRSYPKDVHEMSVGEIDRYDGVLLTLKVETRSWLSYYTEYLASGRVAQGRSLDSYPTGAPSRSLGFGFDTTFPSRLPRRPSYVGDLRHKRQSDIDERFVMEFNTRLQLNRESWKGSDYFRYKMTVNKEQEWHVVSTDNADSHPLHIHINHFQIISYNKYHGAFSLRFEEQYMLYNQDDNKTCHFQREGIDEIFEEEVPDDALRFLGHDERYQQNAGNTLGYARIGDWRDTLLIPPLSNITIRFIPDTYTGVKIIHCHLFGHEDAGMMMATEIVRRGQSREANVKSGNAYPGTCRKCDRYPFNNPRTLCDEPPKRRSRTPGARSFSREQVRKMSAIPKLMFYKVRPRGKGFTKSYPSQR